MYSGTLWINKGLFDKYNLKPPTTLDEWEKVCQEFKKASQGCFVQGAAGAGFDQDTLQAIANSVEPGFWTKASKGDAKWNEPAMVKTLDIWKQLFSRGIMQEGAVGYQQYPDANNDFLTGKYAMVMMGTWYTQYSTEKAMTAALKAAGVSGAKPFPILPIQFPDVGGNTSEMFGDADYGLSISTKAKDKAAAETFVTWLTTSQAGQQAVADQLNDVPALKGIEPNFEEINFVDPATQEAPVKDLLAKVAPVTQPRFALLNQDVQDAIFQAAPVDGYRQGDARGGGEHPAGGGGGGAVAPRAFRQGVRRDGWNIDSGTRASREARARGRRRAGGAAACNRTACHGSCRRSS